MDKYRITYSSIVPSEMTQDELNSIISELFTAKNWDVDKIVVNLANGADYELEVSRINDYRNLKKTHTGAIKL